MEIKPPVAAAIIVVILVVLVGGFFLMENRRSQNGDKMKPVSHDVYAGPYAHPK